MSAELSRIEANVSRLLSASEQLIDNQEAFVQLAKRFATPASAGQAD